MTAKFLNNYPAKNAFRIISQNRKFAIVTCILSLLGIPLFLGAGMMESYLDALSRTRDTYHYSFSCYPYMMIGGFCGGVVVWLAYLSHWKGSDPASMLGVFCTAPNKSREDRNLCCCFITEAIATFFLVTLIMCVFSKGVGLTTPGLGTFFVVGIIYGLGAALGGPTGYALNPARDLSPRIAHFVLPIPGKGDSDWGYSWVPVLGPLVGAVGAYFFCHAVGIM